MIKKLDIKPLIISIFIISICSIVYELIIAASSSYLLGNSIKQFSITIGLYMSAMGIGSYISKYAQKKLFDIFVLIELSIGLLGGLSALLLFISYAYTDIFVLVMYILIILIGILVGLEIPILTRIIESYNHELRITIANVLSFDYLGALIGSILFPIFLFPHLGLIRTSFLIGLLNIIVAGIIIIKYKSFISTKIFNYIFIACSVILILGFIFGDYSADRIEQNLYRDKIIYSKQTPYQKIVMTRHKDDIRVFLDGNIQFSSMDEYRYHEALVHPAMGLNKNVSNVLILGGGDGLAAREIFKYDTIENIDLVDIDREMTEFSRTNPLIKDLNQGSLDNKKLNIYNEDAYKFLENNTTIYDVVIVDLPDPNNESLNKLYTDTFYRLIGNHIAEDGVFVVQSTSPYYAKKAYWCINKTIKSENFHVVPYHIEVPSFGDWGFQLVSKKPISMEDVDVMVDTKFLNESTLSKMTIFAKDEIIDLNTIEINRIFKPVLSMYYEEAE